jgi:aldehyde:ferredoxin oxidoreductase
MTQSCGWAGKILWVDLSNRKIAKAPTSDFEPEKYIGGVGLNSKIFWELGCPQVDAFHSDSPLILSTGPLTGASGPFSRGTMCSIAPQSYPEEYFTYSGFGGKFPAELKYAGYDGIVVVGKSDSPVYLSIHDGEVEIMDAEDLWGLDTFETQRALADRHPRALAHVIGPAGENLSRTAIVITETSGAGEWVPGEQTYWGRYAFMLGRRTMEMWDKYLKRFAGCYGCPYQCQGLYEIPGIGRGTQMCGDGWYAPTGRSPKAMWEGNILSQKLGINNFELTGVVSLLRACIDKEGGLKKEDVGLSSVPFLEPRSESEVENDRAHHLFLEELLSGIADGTSPFSQGLARACEQLGQKAVLDELSPAWGCGNHHVRGVGEALHWAMDTRDPFNSCHDYVQDPKVAFGNNKEIADWFGVPGGYLEGEKEGKHQNIYEGTERLTAWVQHHQSVKNSLPICELASAPAEHFNPPDMDIRVFESRFLSAVTGIDYSVDALWEAGERIFNLRRAIMALREDRHRDDDTLNHLWFEGGVGGLSEPLDRERWEALKDRFYELRGWSVDTGRPTRAKLEALGMKDVADKLESAGKIGI